MTSIFNRLMTLTEGATSAHAANDPQSNHACARQDAARDLATEAAIAATIDGTPAVLISLWTISAAPFAVEYRSAGRRAA